MPEEEWRPVVGYEGLYEVSSQGRVRSLDRARPTSRTSYGKVQTFESVHLGRILSLNSNPPTGRLKVSLTGSNGISRLRSVHTLVCEAFIGPCPPNHEGSHQNGDCTDNRVENLMWELHKDNLARRVEHGTMIGGERHGRAKLTWDRVEYARAQCAAGKTFAELGRELGVNETTIARAVKRRGWR